MHPQEPPTWLRPPAHALFFMAISLVTRRAGACPVVRIHEYNARSLQQREALADRLPQVRVLGPSDPLRRGGIVAFDVPGVHPHDVSQVLDSKGVCVRAGHHCAKPLHRKLGLSASTRASFYLYNDRDDVDAFVDGLEETLHLFGVPAR